VSFVVLKRVVEERDDALGGGLGEEECLEHLQCGPPANTSASGVGEGKGLAVVPPSPNPTALFAAR